VTGAAGHPRGARSAALLPCPSCSRHVRAAESACPFCAAPLPAAFRDFKPPAPPRQRLSRAALFALGAATATTACGGTTSASPSPYEDDSGQAAIADGASTSPNGGDGSFSGQPHYGLPAWDASVPTSTAEGGPGGAPQDGGLGPADATPFAYDGPMAVAAYGIQPIEHDDASTCLNQGEYGCPPH
jgi:hypothetical protein